MAEHPTPWRYEDNNDTGHDDGGFWEWYDLLDADAETVGRAETEALAMRIVEAVNRLG